MPRVHFRFENVTAEVPEGTNLRKACLDNDVDPYPLLKGRLSCHGKGLCATCLVGVDDEDALTKMQKKEQMSLKLRGLLKPGIRLSCQAEVKGDLTVETNPDLEPSWKKHGYYSGRPARSWEESRRSVS